MTVEQFVKKHGGTTRETRTGWLMCCPYPDHSDKTPSCSINFQGLFFCFGCGQKGNFVKLLHDIEGLTWERAKLLAPYAASVLPARASRPKGPSSTLAEMGWFDTDWIEAYKTWQDHQHEETHPPWAMPFNRGIHPTVLLEFQVGYDPEHQWLIIPVFDEHGAYVGRIGRACVPGGTKYFIEPGLSVSEHVFNQHRVREASQVVVVEGLLDVLWFRSHSDVPVVSCFSVHISPRQTQLLLTYHSNFTVFFDGDAAGEKGASEVGSKLYISGGTVDVVPTRDHELTDLKKCPPATLERVLNTAWPWPNTFLRGR